MELPNSYDPSALDTICPWDDLTEEEIEEQYRQWEEEQMMRHLRGDAYPCTVLPEQPVPEF